MKRTSINRLLQLAISCEDTGEVALAEDYLDLALAQASSSNDSDASQLVASRYAAFLRRQGRAEASESLQLLIHRSMRPSHRAKLKLLNSVRRAMYDLRRSGQLTSAEDARAKLANPGWVARHGLSRLSDILNTDLGQETIWLVFQETMSVCAIDRPKVHRAS